MDVIAWLLDSDPTLRWQVERDLVGAPPEVWQATRARIATEGNGAALLAHQDPDGQWAGGAFFPADMTDDEEGQPWTATTWSLTALREWGLDAAALAGTAEQDRGELAVGVRRPALLGRRGGCLHQRDDPRERRVARRRRAARSPRGFPSTSSPTAGGTANGSRARPDRRSTPRSMPSAASSRTRRSPAARPSCELLASGARSTCSSAACGTDCPMGSRSLAGPP